MTKKDYTNIARIVATIRDEDECLSVAQRFGRLFGHSDPKKFDFREFVADIRIERARRESQQRGHIG